MESTHNEYEFLSTAPPRKHPSAPPVCGSTLGGLGGVGVLSSHRWECHNSEGEQIHPLTFWVILVLLVLPKERAQMTGKSSPLG